MLNTWFAIACSFIIISAARGRPDESKWHLNFWGSGSKILSKSLYKGSRVLINNVQRKQQIVNCNTQRSIINISLEIFPSPCWDDIDYMDQLENIMRTHQSLRNTTSMYRINTIYTCANSSILDEHGLNKKEIIINTKNPFYIIPQDGTYVVLLEVNSYIEMEVDVEMRSDYGYLSAIEWPLLPFYGSMCAFYCLLIIVWTIMSLQHWRHLHSVQFWIGGVILLGVVENAAFFTMYLTVNKTGIWRSLWWHRDAETFVELVSSCRSTLARMLLVVVSLGLGIVKRRLGSTLYRVMGIGCVYLFLAANSEFLNSTMKTHYHSNDLMVELIVVDSVICWWICSAVVNTTKALRLCRDDDDGDARLWHYRRFTNTLIFAVIASICFLSYSILTHRIVDCVVVWKDRWLDDAYWHILFSAILLVIMVLWRPTNIQSFFLMKAPFQAHHQNIKNENDFCTSSRCVLCAMLLYFSLMMFVEHYFFG